VTSSQPADPWIFPAAPSPDPSSGYPTPAGPGTDARAFGAGPVIVQIGEIGVTSAVVHTPAGDIPLAGSTWQVSDYWHSEQRIPKWAIVLAIVGFCVLTVLSLLFLLIKETVQRGTVQVTVTNGTRQYVARIPVTDQTQVTQIHQQVNYVRSLAAL
jgi:hypothetical protein